MKTLLRLLSVSLVASAALFSAPMSASAQEGSITSLSQLLNRVQQGRVRDNQVNEERIRQFQADRNRQSALLNQAERDLASEEARADRLEAQFNANELEIESLSEQLTSALGDFGELFGVMRQVAGDTRAQVNQSMISAQYPGRGRIMDRLTNSRQLPSVADIEDMWFVLQQEAIEQGKIVRFEGTVFASGGAATQRDVIRLGPFTAITADTGEFLRFRADEDGTLEVLARQPAARFRGAANNVRNADEGQMVLGAIDPSQGTILSLLIQTPDLVERISQGKEVGYATIVVGVFGVLLALLRIFGLFGTSGAVRSQARKVDAPKKGNPLGRILQAYHDNKNVDVETLELKLDEAILKEMPGLEWGLNTVRVLAAVAPLMGLLGTVVGMIIVFQQITLFGTGDPKLMAGGISQALVTTVIGLCVAIPLLLLHSIASGMSRSVAQVLEEQAAGLVASHAETHRG